MGKLFFLAVIAGTLLLVASASGAGKPSIFAAPHGTQIVQVSGENFREQEFIRLGIAGFVFTEPVITTTDTGKFLVDYEHPTGDEYEAGDYTFIASRWTNKGWKEVAQTTITIGE